MRVGRPPVGSWLLYGLGSQSENLPGYVVLKTGPEPDGGSSNWSNGFLPSDYQGVLLRSEGPPILNLDNPAGMTPVAHRCSLDAIDELESTAVSSRGRPRDLNANRQLRIGVPHAVGRARIDRHFGRVGRHIAGLRPRPRRPRSKKFLAQLPVGTAHCRTGRAICEHLFRQLGRSFQPDSQPHATLRDRRSTHRGLAQRPQATRPVGYHARRLGGRIRSHAGRRKPLDGWRPSAAAITIPTPSRSGWPAAAFPAAESSARPTNWDGMPSKTRWISTICTPRCSTCSASTTSD